MKNISKLSPLSLVLLRIATGLRAAPEHVRVTSDLLAFINLVVEREAAHGLEDEEILTKVAYDLNFDRVAFVRAGYEKGARRRFNMASLFLGAVGLECSKSLVRVVRSSYDAGATDHDAVTDEAARAHALSAKTDIAVGL